MAGLLDTIYSAGRTGAGLIDSALGKIGNVQDMGLLAESLQRAARPKRLYEGTGTLARLSEARGTYRDSLLQRRKLEEDIEYKKSLTAYNQASAEQRAAEIQSRQQTQLGLNQYQGTLINAIQASPYLTNADRLTINALGEVATPQSIQGLGRMLSKYQTAAALPSKEDRTKYLNLGGPMRTKFAEQTLFPSGSTDKGEIKEVNGQLWRIKDGVATPVMTEDEQPLIEAPEPEGIDKQKEDVLRNLRLDNVEQTKRIDEITAKGQSDKDIDERAVTAYREISLQARDLKADVKNLIDNGAFKGYSAVGGGSFLEWLKNVPIVGKNATRVEKKITALQAVLAFNQLIEMRKAGGPHGGALGNVSNQELESLKQAFGALSQSMSPEDFMKAMDDIIAKIDRGAGYLFKGAPDPIRGYVNNETRQVLYAGTPLPVEGRSLIFRGGPIFYREDLKDEKKIENLQRYLFEPYDYQKDIDALRNR